MEMPKVSNGFSEMRFRKSVIFMNKSYRMNGTMYRLFFALDENKTMAQLASQQQMDPAVMMESIIKLWDLGLIEPIGLTNLIVDSNFSKLLKINLHYILGNKNIAYSCVDSTLKELDLAHDQLTASHVSALVDAVAEKIADTAIRKKFQDFMETLLPLRTKIKPFWGLGPKNQMLGSTNVSRGKTRQIIDRIILTRSGGNPLIAKNVKTKLMLKGINLDSYFEDTPDDPKTLKVLIGLAAKMGVDLGECGFSAVSPKETRGQIQRFLSDIIENRSKQNPLIAKYIKAKLFLKGIDVDRYGPETPDDPAVLDKIKKLALSMNMKGA